MNKTTHRPSQSYAQHCPQTGQKGRQSPFKCKIKQCHRQARHPDTSQNLRCLSGPSSPPQNEPRSQIGQNRGQRSIANGQKKAGNRAAKPKSYQKRRRDPKDD